MKNTESSLRVNQNIAVERFQDGDAVILDSENQYTHILNSTALKIFDLCEGKTPLDILNLLLEFYENEILIEPDLKDRIKEDTHLVLSQLLEKGVIYENR